MREQSRNHYAYENAFPDETKRYDRNGVQEEPQPFLSEAEMQKRKKIPFLVWLVILFICAVAAVILLQRYVFRLEYVSVEGNQTKSNEYVVATAGLVRGLNIFSINAEEIEQNLKKDHTLEFVGMQKKYPNSLYLYVKERKPVAAFQNNGILYTLDENGIVMNEDYTTLVPDEMPMLAGFSGVNAHVGQPLKIRNEEQLFAYQQIMQELQLQLYRNQIAKINLSDLENLYLTTVDGISIRIGSAEYARAKIGAAQPIVSYLRRLGKKNGVLDVSIPEDAKYTPDI